MIQLPPGVQLAIFDNGDTALIKVNRDVRMVRMFFISNNHLHKKDIPVIDWNYFCSQKTVRVLTAKEQVPYQNIIDRIYIAVMKMANQRSA